MGRSAGLPYRDVISGSLRRSDEAASILLDPDLRSVPHSYSRSLSMRSPHPLHRASQVAERNAYPSGPQRLERTDSALQLQANRTTNSRFPTFRPYRDFRSYRSRRGRSKGIDRTDCPGRASRTARSFANVAMLALRKFRFCLAIKLMSRSNVKFSCSCGSRAFCGPTGCVGAAAIGCNASWTSVAQPTSAAAPNPAVRSCTISTDIANPACREPDIATTVRVPRAAPAMNSAHATVAASTATEARAARHVYEPGRAEHRPTHTTSEPSRRPLPERPCPEWRVPDEEIEHHDIEIRRVLGGTRQNVRQDVQRQVQLQLRPGRVLWSHRLRAGRNCRLQRQLGISVARRRAASTPERASTPRHRSDLRVDGPQRYLLRRSAAIPLPTGPLRRADAYSSCRRSSHRPSGRALRDGRGRHRRDARLRTLGRARERSRGSRMQGTSSFRAGSPQGRGTAPVALEPERARERPRDRS